MRHKHADLIHAWAEGAEIEIYDLCVDQWKPSRHPTFYAACKYRIKPTPKPDVVHLYYVDDGELIKCKKTIGPCEDPHDLRVTFDGETKKLKSAEVIK